MNLPEVGDIFTPFRVIVVCAVMFFTPFVLCGVFAGGLALMRLTGRGSAYDPLPSPDRIGERVNPGEGHCIQFTGRLGSGKTSLAVRRAVKHARKHHLPLITNAPIRTDGIVVRSWEDIDRLPTCVDLGITPCANGCHLIPGSTGCHPAVLFLDELHLWYPSATTLMPKEQQQQAFKVLSYARKRGWTVFATTQAPKRVHTGWRQLMTEQYAVKPVSRGYLHRAAMLDIEDDGGVIMPIASLFCPFRAQYNTRAEVAPLWSLEDGDGGRRYLSIEEAQRVLGEIEAGRLVEGATQLTAPVVKAHAGW